MRLHGITKLILFAVALRFVANCVALSSAYAKLDQANTFPFLTGTVFDVLGYRFQEFSEILLYVGDAAFIEMLARIHSHLRRVRLSGSGSGAISDV